MKLHLKQHLKRAVCGLISISMLAQPLAASAAQLNLSQSPLFVSVPIPPLVMLDISKDQQLYKKAYTDFSDLDGDGTLDITYNHGIDYYGYFDSYKCYTYNASNKRYEPAVYHTKDTSSGATSSSATNLTAKYCNVSPATNQWSGNFLNWASMTRMDAVRKLLYGGLRSPNRVSGDSSDGGTLSDGDTATSTVLERTFLPNDAHSFAKYYGGTDINQLTPFTASIATTTSSSSVTIGTGDITFTLASTTGFSNNDIVKVASAASPTNFVSGVVKNKSSTQITLDSVTALNTSGSGSFNAWTVTNLSAGGVTMCNTTKGSTSSPNNRSQTNTNLPRLRVARGNYSLWSANERWQCLWSNEQSVTPITNDFKKSNVPSYSGSPDRTTVGLDNKSNTDGQGDYFVRIQACVAGLFGTEKCKEYNTNNYSKPIGLLQVYGDTGQIQFGLMTGSYTKNISGGVLRKNIGPFTDEVSADGTFTALASTGIAGGGALTSGYPMPAGGSIITTLNKMRIWGYSYNDGTYTGGGTIDDCTFQLTSITEGKCVSWGNPMSEIYYESLRYFAGQPTPTSAFNTDDSGKIAGLATATWPGIPTGSPAGTTNSPIILSNSNYCAPPNILVFNASVSTNETDSQIGNPFTGISGFNAVTVTNTVGTAEGVASPAKFFIGRTSATGSTATDNEYCDAKTSTGLGNMYGICPEGPTLAGSYLMAGLAYTAHTSRIRNDLTTVPTADTKALKVNTYGISLATNVPQVPVTLSGSTTPRVIIQPAYRLINSSGNGGGTLVDMQVVSRSASATGAKGGISLNWEDSEQGGDYDQDMWGTLNYCMQTGTDTTTCPGQAPNTLTVTTVALGESTNQPQGFGYIVSGTTQDGPHFHTGIENFNYADPARITVLPTTHIEATSATSGGGCSNCNVSDVATTATYNLSTSSSAASPLKDPLWYAAKYGGFSDTNTTGTATPVPDLTTEWDVYKADGTAGSDGNPDNYFLVSNPLGLETSLNRVFLSIIATASASAAAANSSRVTTNTKIYQAVFNTQDWSSKLLSYSVDATTGVPSTTANWDAGQQTKLAAASATGSDRVILTSNKGITSAAPTGIPFRWPSNPASPASNELTVAQTTGLKTNPATATVQADSVGQDRLNYVRGSGANEGSGTGDFRARTFTKLGDIVNSNINYVAGPNAGYADPAYGTFASNYAARTPMLYVGANDGMMHAFNANTGDEMMAFVPGKLVPKLNQLTRQPYSHTYYVDGSPIVGDALLGTAPSAAWKTILVGGYNAGGQGLYALDVTNPTTANFTEANAANIVKWEFTDTDDPDLGFTYGNPVIAKMANGKWAAIVSGGYNNSDSTGAGEVTCTGGTGTVASPYTPAGCSISTNGKAFLFVINLDGPTGSNGKWVQGTDYFKISTGVGSTGTPNGLAAPFAADINGDTVTDFVYAGDLQGNLWKFDLRDTNPANWTNSSKLFKMFTAVDSGGVAQPITSRVDWALHPTGQGFIVSFGTGKYLEGTDVTPASAFTTQTVYGIWDKNDNTNISSQTTVPGRSVLMQQIVLTYSASNPRYRVLSKFQPNYSSAPISVTVTAGDPNRVADVSGSVPAQYGWYFDLYNSSAYAVGERNIYNPDLVNGIAFYSSLWPSNNACLGAADGDNLVFSIGTGARPDFSVFDLNGNAIANSGDFVTVGGVAVPISSLAIQGGASQTPTFIRMPGTTGASASGYGLSTGASGQNAGTQSTSGGGLSTAIYNLGVDFGRVSWREILND